MLTLQSLGIVLTFTTQNHIIRVIYKKMVWLPLFLLVAMVSPRVFEQTFTYSAFRRQYGWIYLNKMVLSPGTSDIKFESSVKGSLMTPIDVEFAVINQREFGTQSHYKCNNSNYQPTLSVLHTLQPNNIPSVTSTTLTTDTQQLYYFLLRDCKRQIISNASLNTIVVSTKLVIINNSSHLGSQEDAWIIYPTALFVYLLLLWIINRQKPLEGEKNWLQVSLLIGFVARLCAIFWKTIGFLFYWRAGNNYTIFEIFYLAMSGLSECIIISILILIGFGWYILFINHSDFDIYVTLLALLSALNIVLNLLNVINDDSYDKHHMYDSIPSIIQTAFRIIALFCFVGGIKLEWKKLNPAAKSFMLKFIVFGVTYILSLPITLIVASMVQKSNRPQFVVVASELFQLASAGYLTYLSTYKRSGYNRVSITNTTFLPVQQNQKYF